MNLAAFFQWKLSNEPCIDFVTSKLWVGGTPADDLFTSYVRLVEWCRHIRVLSEEESKRQISLSKTRRGEADSVLEKAVQLRESVHRIFSACARREAPSAEDLALLNRELSAALSHIRISRPSAKFSWSWSKIDAPLGWILWPVWRSAAELLTSDRLRRVRQCSGCRWLFMDSSRNASRRWCSMKICGNRAKARRYYARHRGAGPSKKTKPG
jgi:predicted RNA-binding Zn ribbon-like protein